MVRPDLDPDLAIVLSGPPPLTTPRLRPPLGPVCADSEHGRKTLGRTGVAG